MRVGTIRERKNEEFRVGLTPAGVKALTGQGDSVLVESGAGVGSGFLDSDYEAAGATVAGSAAEVAAAVDLLVKVKEILPSEYSLLRPGLLLFTYLHLSPEPGLTRELMESGTNAIAYETVQLADGSLPLLIPMSRVAGRMAGEIAAQYLKRPGPGRGMLLGGVAGVAPGKAVVVGSGTVGRAASEVLLGLGSQVTVFGRKESKVVALAKALGEGARGKVSSVDDLRASLAGADVLIGGVLDHAALAPKLISREMVRSMGAGAVIVDVCIDQGGICETSRVTSHDAPTYVEEGVIHYCVPNMPGAVPRTSTQALTNATLPYVLALAAKGLSALADDASLAAGAATIGGRLTSEVVARTQGITYTPLEEALEAA